VDREIGRTGLWHLTITIHADFLTTGGFGVLLENEGVEASPSMCIEHDECVPSKFYEKNTAILSSYFTPGDYRLKFYLNEPQLAFL
jgi:hypothetical protein